MAKKKKEQLEVPKKKKTASKGAVKKSVVPASLPVLVPAGAAASPKAEKPVVKPKKAPVKKKKAVSFRPFEIVEVTVEEIFLTTDEIAVRAYHLSEHRRTHGIWGDETGDWVEAERQLRAEKAGK